MHADEPRSDNGAPSISREDIARVAEAEEKQGVVDQQTITSASSLQQKETEGGDKAG